jgi:hypothetical protein
MARRLDKPAEPQEAEPNAPAGSAPTTQPPTTPQPAGSVQQHPNRLDTSREATPATPRPQESPDAPQPDRPLTWKEQLEANREVRYFPGWGGPDDQSSGQAGWGGSGESGTSFVFGKVFETRRGMEGLAEAKRDDVGVEPGGRTAPVSGRQPDRIEDVGVDADERPDDQSEGRPDAIREAEANPERYAGERAAELQQMLPEKARGRITMGTGVGLDDAGGMHVVVGTSEPRGYLRPGVTLREGEELATGPGHAEPSILDYMVERQISPSHIGAGRPVCDPCADSIDAAGASAASPYKNPNRARDI